MCGPRANSLCNTWGPVKPPPGSMELDLHLTNSQVICAESLTITGPQDAIELGYSIILLYGPVHWPFTEQPSHEMLQHLLLMAKEIWHILLFLCILLHS